HDLVERDAGDHSVLYAMVPRPVTPEFDSADAIAEHVEIDDERASPQAEAHDVERVLVAAPVSEHPSDAELRRPGDRATARVGADQRRELTARIDAPAEVEHGSELDEERKPVLEQYPSAGDESECAC